MDDALRIRLDLLVLSLFVCASFLGTIAVGVTGTKALGTSMFFFGVWSVFSFFFVQWRGLRSEDDTNSRSGKRHRRPHLHRRRGRDQRTREKPRRGDGVPELRALSPQDGRGEHGIRPPDEYRPLEGRAPRTGVRGCRDDGNRGPALGQTGRVVRRAETARRARTRHRARTRRLPLRRTAVEPRRKITNDDAHRNPADSAGTRNHVRLRHPRPGRGDDDGDRIVILRDGELQQMGAPTDVYDRPTNRFVGGSIGSPSMNFIDVRASSKGEDVVLTHSDGAFSCRLSPSFGDRIEDIDGEFTVGIRPEDIFPASEGHKNVLATTVEVVEPIGSDNYLYLDAAEDFIARVDSDVEPAPGETIRVTFAEDDVHVFDGESGRVVAEKGKVAGRASV